jgi:prepilin-type N-terminal cleavage/methylation domain-containing protein
VDLPSEAVDIANNVATDEEPHVKRKSPNPIGLPHAQRREGFTLLEMIVTIGIILVLLAIAVVGYRSLDASASKKDTAIALTNLQAMVGELESTAGLTRIEGPGGVYAIKDRITRPGNGTVPNPGDVASGTGETARYGPAVRRTQDVIARLSQVPKNKTAIGQIPGKRLLGRPASPYAADPNKVALDTTGKNLPTPPVPVDGWRNPILFVPSGGIEGVNVGAKPDGTYDAPNQTITAPSNRPFWASAGPDGDFTKGDDNIYSFSK